MSNIEDSVHLVKDHLDDLYPWPNSHWTPYILYELLEEITKIRVILQPRLSATLTIKSHHHHGENMPASIQIGSTATSTWQEWDGPNGTGNPLPPAGPVAYASDNTAVATVDPATGKVTGVSAGTASISGTDSTNSLTASDTITVTAVVVPAVSATLTLVSDAPAPKA